MRYDLKSISDACVKRFRLAYYTSFCMGIATLLIIPLISFFVVKNLISFLVILSSSLLFLGAIIYVFKDSISSKGLLKKNVTYLVLDRESLELNTFDMFIYPLISLFPLSFLLTYYTMDMYMLITAMVVLSFVIMGIFLALTKLLSTPLRIVEERYIVRNVKNADLSRLVKKLINIAIDLCQFYDTSGFFETINLLNDFRKTFDVLSKEDPNFKRHLKGLKQLSKLNLDTEYARGESTEEYLWNLGEKLLVLARTIISLLERKTGYPVYIGGYNIDEIEYIQNELQKLRR